MSPELKLVAFDIEGTLTVDPTVWEIMPGGYTPAPLDPLMEGQDDVLAAGADLVTLDDPEEE